MKKFWEVAKKHEDIIAYVVLTVLLLGACFVPNFAWIATGFAFAMAIYFHDETKLLGLVFYLHCFYILFNYQHLFGISLDIIIAGFFIVELLCLHLYRVRKHKLKINLKTVIPIALFFVYLLLPMHQYNFRDYFATLFFFIFVYVVFGERRQIDFCYLVRMLAMGLIVSCLFASLRNISPLLTEKINANGYYGRVSFRGLTFHQNTLYGLIVIAICGLLLMKYKNKISALELVFSFIPLFVFGYLTLSRAFIATVFAGIIIFTILYFMQDRVKSLALFGSFAAIICIVGGLFFGATKVYFKRISNDFENFPKTQIKRTLVIKNLEETFDNQPEDWKQAVLAGEIHYDPGRPDLRTLYLRDWSSSAQTIWFGRGISRPLIGQMSAHNLYVQELWKHGIIGYVFYLAMFVGSINWKKVKSQIKRYTPLLIVVVPFFMATTVEQCLLDYIRIGVTLACVGFLEQITKNNKKCFHISDKL